MHDSSIEDRLRATLRSEADDLPLTVTTEELERRLALRRRDRMNRRLGLLAAGIAAIAVGTAVAVAVGPFRGPDVAATPRPTIEPTVPVPSPVVSSGPVDPDQITAPLDPTQGAVDSVETSQPGEASSTDSFMESVIAFEPVRTDAREARFKVLCLGPDDARLSWGTPEDRGAIASESIRCDGHVESLRYDLTGRQPLIDHWIWIDATVRTHYRVLLETFGHTNVPAPVELPDLATPAGTVLLDTRIDAGTAPGGTPGTGRAGDVPPRGTYRVAMVCLGSGSARWTIGAEGASDFIDAGEVPCDGAAVGFSSTTGMPSADPTVYVSTDPGASWHLVITYPYGPPAFIPPTLQMWAGADMEGSPTSGPAQCVGYDSNVDSCGLSLSPRDGAPVVTVPTGADVSLRLGDGWSFTQASVRVADRGAVRSDPTNAEFRDVGLLEDGAGPISADGDRMTASVASLEPGEWIVIVTVSATKGGHTFGATYLMPLRIDG
jgi:hypothetical protein